MSTPKGEPRERRKLPVDREALTTLRIDRRMTLSELGRRAGVSASHISAVELGADIRPETLGKLADALGVPMSRLLKPAGRAS
jgi:transcriptional regulator with XRE-family HTH domain